MSAPLDFTMSATRCRLSTPPASLPACTLYTSTLSGALGVGVVRGLWHAVSATSATSAMANWLSVFTAIQYHGYNNAVILMPPQRGVGPAFTRLQEQVLRSHQDDCSGLST